MAQIGLAKTLESEIENIQHKLTSFGSINFGSSCRFEGTEDRYAARLGSAPWMNKMDRTRRNLYKVSTEPRRLRWMGESPSSEFLHREINPKDVALYRKGDTYYCEVWESNEEIQIDFREWGICNEGGQLNSIILDNDQVSVKPMEIGYLYKSSKNKSGKQKELNNSDYDIDFKNELTQTALIEYLASHGYIPQPGPLTLKFKDLKLKYIPSRDEIRVGFTIPFSLGTELNNLEVTYNFYDDTSKDITRPYAIGMEL